MTMNALWWWIDRWRKSTAYTDMTLEQQGAYRNLLDEASLRGGAIPDDERVLAKACGDAKAWRRLRTVMLARFELQADGWHNETLDAVLLRSQEIRTARAESGRLGGLTKAAKAASKASKHPSKHPSKNLANEVAKPLANELAKTYPPDPDPDPDLDPTKNVGSRVPHTRARTTGHGANEPGSLPRDHMHHSICGPSLRICLSVWECGVLMQAYGGPPELQKAAVATFVYLLDSSMGPDDAPGAFSDVEKNFKRWMKSIGRTAFTLKPDDADSEAEMVAMLEADIADRKGRSS